MNLLEELQEKRFNADDLRKTFEEKRDGFIRAVDMQSDYIADLDRAIAALTPTPDFSAEKETAREQLEREPEIPEGFLPWQGGERLLDAKTPVHVMLRNGGLSDMWGAGQWDGHWNWREREHYSTDIIAYRIIEASPAPDPDEQDDASEFAEPMPDAEFVVLDEQTCEPVEEAPALNADMQDEREQPAPATNPEADTIARAHEYYSPEKMGDRNRSVFDIFRHKREDA